MPYDAENYRFIDPDVEQDTLATTWLKFHDTLESVQEVAGNYPTAPLCTDQIHQRREAHIRSARNLAEHMLGIEKDAIFTSTEVSYVAGLLAVTQCQSWQDTAQKQKIPIVPHESVTIPPCWENAEFMGEAALAPVDAAYANLLDQNMGLWQNSVRAVQLEKRASRIKNTVMFLGGALAGLASQSLIRRFRA